MNPKVTKIPGFPKPPAGVSPALRIYLEALAEALDIRLGRRGDPVDRAVTLRELISSGLAVELRANPFDPNNPSDNPGFVDPTKAVVTDIPLRPTGFSVAGAYSIINMVWDFANYSTHALTEIWSHSSDSLGDATFAGSSTGRTYMDPVGSGVTRYYWIRHVNTAGTYGPWNSTTGTVGQTAVDVDHLLDVLTDAITSSELATNLESRINLIDGAATLQYSAAWRVAQEATARASAIADEATARAAAILALVTGIPIYDSSKDYVVGQIVRAGNTNSKLYIAIQAVAASASIALTNAAYWKVYGDYDLLKTSTDDSEANIVDLNTISATSGSAAARSLHALTATVNDSSTGVAATATALSTLSTEVYASGGVSASRIDALTATVNNTETGVAATATALSTLSTEVYASGGVSASRIDALTATVDNTETGVAATATALSTLSTEVYASGGVSASRIDALTATVDNTSTGVTATSQALSYLSAEVYGSGGASASRIDGLESVILVNGSPVVSATNLSTMKTSVLNTNGTARASASQIDFLNANYTNPETGVTNNVTLQQALNTTASNVNGLRGEYTVKVDANGHVAGFGLANTYDNESETATSEFFVNADKFAILPFAASSATAAWVSGTTYSAGAKVKHLNKIHQARRTNNSVTPTAGNSLDWDNLSISPFAVTADGSTINGTYVPAGVYINSAMIKHASITAAQIGTVNADTIETGTLDVATLITADSIDVRKLVIGGSVIESEARSSDGKHFLKIGAASITTALIGDAQISTLKVAGNAITATGYAQKLFTSSGNSLTLSMPTAANVTAGQPFIFNITAIVNNTSANNAVLSPAQTYDLKITTYTNGQSAQSNTYWIYAYGTDCFSIQRTSGAAGHAVSCKVECFVHGGTTAIPSCLIQMTAHTGKR